MSPDKFQALVIDRYFGELSPEVSELLDAHLAQNPAAQLEAQDIIVTLGLMEKAVEPVLPKVKRGLSWSDTTAWGLTASLLVILLLGVTFWVNDKKTPEPVLGVEGTEQEEMMGWTRYKFHAVTGTLVVVKSTDPVGGSEP